MNPFLILALIATWAVVIQQYLRLKDLEAERDRLFKLLQEDRP
ncbi:hypothetical protein SJI00_07315 [Pseudomonas sp. RP23018S]|nr:hypothetical protein [Pseudomonas sp. RP23018S]MDZ5602579.1 hypothetical protein [Pseudomonas sp. RP23018S]